MLSFESKGDRRPSPEVATASVFEAPVRVLAKIDTLAIGDVLDFSYPSSNDPAFVIRLAGSARGGIGPEQGIVGFCRPCPHLGCPITALDPHSGIAGPCVCHRSRFDLRDAGRQIVGRASQNLVQIELEQRGDDIVAVGLGGIPFGYALEAAPPEGIDR